MLAMVPMLDKLGTGPKESLTNILTTPVFGGIVLWNFLVMLVLVCIALISIWTMWKRVKNQRDVIGNLLVGWVPENGQEWECLCPVIGAGMEIKPPTGKQYKRITGGERKEELPGTYFIGPSREGERSPITTVKYPRGAWSLMQVQVGYVRFREIDSNPLDPWCQEELVDPIVVTAKTHRALAELILESTKDQLEVFKNIGKQLREMKPPAAWIVYLGLGLAVCLGVISLVMSQTSMKQVNEELTRIIEAMGIATTGGK